MTLRLSRRAVLRGMGALVALPALEAMQARPARAQSAGAPRRFVAFFVPNGMRMDAFTPRTAGPLDELPPLLEPLARVKEQVLVLSGLRNFPATDQGDGGGAHARGTATFLSARRPQKTAGENLQNGVSVDQVAAAHLRGQTRFPSLELGCEGGPPVGSCDSGYSCAYVRNISWAGPSTPLAKEVNPRAVFDRLFAGSDAALTEEQKATRKRRRLSILDFVRDDAARLQQQLGASDRRKLDEYLTGVRELERRVASPAVEAACAFPERPDGVPGDLEEYVRVMCDLLVLALQCDLTRVATFMLGNGGSNRSYGFLGHPGGHHEYSHHKGERKNLEALTAIGRWEVGQLAYLLERMASTPDGEGTLLDASAVYFGSEIADGNLHDHESMPVVVGGGGGGLLRRGEHVVVPEGTPVANLFLALLSTMGVQMASFGDDGTAPLREALL